jgi:hypothetical protein
VKQQGTVLYSEVAGTSAVLLLVASVLSRGPLLKSLVLLTLAAAAAVVYPFYSR